MHTPGTSPDLPRRAVLGGALATAGALVLAACASTGMPISLTEAIRRLLLLSTERAFVRLTQPGGT